MLINVNFPSRPAGEVTGMRLGRQGRRAGGIEVVELRDPVGRPYLWIGDFSSDESIDPTSDLAATRDGAIAVTPLHLDLTHEATLRSLTKLFP